MKRQFQAVGVMASTFVLLAALVHIDPFKRMCHAMDRMFGAPPEWTQITNLYIDPKTQEITHGEDPVHSLGILKGYWHGRSQGSKIVFVGNSQMHSVNLASGEFPRNAPEKTYVDEVIDELQGEIPDELSYRLSSSGMSYPEALWEITYLLDDPDLRPGIIFLQMNYQFFATGGIRDSVLPMLRRPSFRARVEAFAGSARSDATVYADALRRYDDQVAREKSKSEINADIGLASVFSPQVTPGYWIETRARDLLETVSPADHRADLKESFEQVLYRGRLYVLRLKPSSARSITGSRLLAARSAVDSIAALCAASNVRLVLFHAPVNPTVQLYRTPQDSESYHQFVSRVAAAHRIPVFDFEKSIGPEHWGTMLNSPEPLHMGRIAHQQMAKQILAAINSVQVKN